MEIRKIFLTILIGILVSSTISIAQREGWGLRTFSLILGELPKACVREVTPECFSCLLYVKLFPLLFFLALFFLIFFYVVQMMIPRRPIQDPMTGEIRIPSPSPFEMKVITILSVILSLVLLNAFTIKTILSQFMFWIGLMFFALALLLIRGVARLGGLGIILGIIFAIILFAVLWSFIGGLVSPVIEGWIRLCT